MTLSDVSLAFRCLALIFPLNFGLGKMAVVFSLAHVLSLSSSTPTPDDWAADTPFAHLTSDERADDSYTSAYINVSREEDKGWKWDRTDVGRYGMGYVGPAGGLVVHVTSQNDSEDHTGCRLPLRSTRSDGRLPPPGEPWIALIKRGRCNFEVKVENAFRSTAAGVLIYNDRDSSTLDKMRLSTDSRRNISAVFTYKWKGEELAKLSENDSKVYVQMTIGRHTSSRTANINRTSVLFVSITFIVLMIISLAWLVFYYVQRFRYIHAKDRLSKRLGNAAKKALSKIPVKSIRTDDKEVQGDGECCAICIDPYKLSDILRILPCSHEFHKNCIDPWLLEHRTCPMCKMDILKHYGFVFTGSQESILQLENEEVGSIDDSPRHDGGVSPMPEIRATLVSERQRFYVNSGDDHSSRASTPDEMTPSLYSSLRQTPVRQDLCVSCIAAAAAASLAASNAANNSAVQDGEERGQRQKREKRSGNNQPPPATAASTSSSVSTTTSSSSSNSSKMVNDDDGDLQEGDDVKNKKRDS